MTLSVARPPLVPEPGMDREEMLEMQDRIRHEAVFTDDLDGDLADLCLGGVDLAFPDEDALAAAVSMVDGEIVDRATVRRPVALPYIPGLLAFREAGPLLKAVTTLDPPPDVLLCDGNGRIHPREAGIGTHVGLALDLPTVGVAKSLLCGELVDPPDTPFPVGTRIPIRSETDPEVSLGYAVQTRQWDRPDRHINPVYVSPGHRVSDETAVELVYQSTAGYKLPEPIRAADHLANERAHEP